MAKYKKQLGLEGEQLAVRFLRRKDYSIVATNWRCKQGEIDIIAKQGEILVFVEVRTRNASVTAPAFESITPQKRKRLEELVYIYLMETNQSDVFWRVDVVGIALTVSGQIVIDHAEDALGW